MLWSPTGPAAAAGTASGEPFRAATNIAANLGGVAWVFNDTATSETFTLGGSAVTNSLAIPLGPNQGMFIAYGPADTHIIASVATVFAVPGIARP